MKTVTLQLTQKCYIEFYRLAKLENIPVEIFLSKKLTSLLPVSSNQIPLPGSLRNEMYFKNETSNFLSRLGEQYLISLFETGIGPTKATKLMIGITQQAASYRFKQWKTSK